MDKEHCYNTDCQGSEWCHCRCGQCKLTKENEKEESLAPPQSQQ